MKVTVGRNAMDASVVLADGTDVTKQLHIGRIEVHVVPGEHTRVTMMCYPRHVEVDIPDGGVTVLAALGREEEA